MHNQVEESDNNSRFHILHLHLTMLTILVFAFSLNAASELPVKFEHLTTKDGLSQNSVYAILQDSDGFMWFGTRFGLSRYDGTEFKIFRHDPLKTSTLPDFLITVLYEDSQGDIWIGTRNGGVAKFQKQLENFINFKHDPEDSNSISGNHVTAIFEDSKGSIWIGTEDGLCRYDKSTNSLTTIRYHSDNPKLINENRISALAEFPEGKLWIGTENGSLMTLSLDSLTMTQIIGGSANTSISIKSLLVDKINNVMWIGQFGYSLFQFDPSYGEFENFGISNGKAIFELVGISSISQAKDGNLWIGTAAGLVKFDPETRDYQVFRHNGNDPTSLSDNMIYSTNIDDQCSIWVGTESGGIDKYDPDLIRFEHHRSESNNANSINSNMVFSISKDPQDNIWFGTLGGGISILNPQTGIFTHYTSDDTKVSWSRNYISRILPARDGTAWIGTYVCGLFTLNPLTEEFGHYRNIDSDGTSFGDKTTRAILETRDGTIWIGTESQGLDQFNKQTKTFNHFRNDPNNSNSLISNNIYALLEDQTGFIWIGTADKGLDRFDPRSETFIHYQVSHSGEQSISGNNVLALYEDPQQNLWIGTRSGGLNKLSPDRKIISTLDLKAELSSLTVFGILQDDTGFLWLSTNQGLLKAHPDSGLVNTYTMSDGLQQEFYFSSCARGADGQMYFGGIDGYNVFHPDSIKNNTHIPPIVLTGLAVNYENVAIGKDLSDREILDRSIAYTKEIRLNYQDKVIGFKFAALNYAASYKNQYAYKLEGYDKEWIHSGTENYAQYMNLPAGDYTFRVRGSNNDGIWNLEGTYISVIISPPFWKTLWFNLLLVVGLIAVIIAYIHLRTMNLLAQRIKLEAIVRERTGQLKSEIEERQKVESEKTQIQLDHLKRELLTQSLHLNDKQQIMDNLQAELEGFSRLKFDTIKPKVNKLLRFLRDRKSVNQGWEEFELWFTEVHTSFYSELRMAYPELTEMELKVCALLRLNLISKDIANVMNVQPTTVDTYRHRIRKKMALTGEDNLATVLAQY